MKEPRKAAKEGGDSDFMRTMRERYDRITERERPNRVLALDDLRFVAVPGNQWDDTAKKARKNRPCYEFPILRAHWRQVVNDQKKARPAIKVRALKDATQEGAELRQGIIRNIESVCNAAQAYDSAFELLSAVGYGAWRVTTEYSDDDAWDQDFAIRPIKDPLSSVWMAEDGSHGFVEETISHDEFKKRYPNAEKVDFDSEAAKTASGWYGEDEVRIAEYWRLEPVQKVLHLLSDGRTVDGEEYAKIADELAEQGIESIRERPCQGHRVVMSIVSGMEELDGPHESVFHEIPIVELYANRHYIDGKWHWMGMVRPSRDPQKLLNYNFTAGQEALAKQHKATPLVTSKMLEGKGVKAMWDASNAADAPYLPFTPDPQMPQGPSYLQAPPIHMAFTAMGQMSIDMLKASDGIYDASVGARSNETSGKAILARQQEGDTATFDYQDKLAEGIQRTGELIGKALHKVYDTPRAVRVIGKDGGEDFKQLYEEVVDRQTGQTVVVNDLSAGKYDYTVSVGASYDTQRMEFVDALVQLSQGNPLVQQAVPDLIVGSMDFPKADEAAERLKAVLPPPVQAMLQKDKQMPPEIMAALQQIEQQGQMLQQGMAQLQEEAVKVQAEKSAVDSAKVALDADRKVFKAEVDKTKAEFKAMQVEASVEATQTAPEAPQAKQPQQGAGELAVANAVAQSLQQTVQQVDAAQAVLGQVEGMLQQIAQHAESINRPRKKVGRIRRDVDGSHIVEIDES